MEGAGLTPLGMNAAHASDYGFYGRVDRTATEFTVFSLATAAVNVPISTSPRATAPSQLHAPPFSFSAFSRGIPLRERRLDESRTLMKAGEGAGWCRSEGVFDVSGLVGKPRSRLLSVPLYTSVLLGRKFV